MKLLELTLPTLAENLALDEALLKAADEHQSLDCEVLRLWHADNVGVVVGRSSKVADEVYLDQAAAQQVPVLRRPSGGATVAIGPGCLLYTLLMDLNAQPALRMLDAVHDYVMCGMIEAIRPFAPRVRFNGTCDLVLNERKFSGNSLKVGRNWTLYHGTLLLNMDLAIIDQLLKHPPREPEYRKGRAHSEFVTNLNVDADALCESLRKTWRADSALEEIPQGLARELLVSRYSQANWNLQR